jgi:hypothetical protein
MAVGGDDHRDERRLAGLETRGDQIVEARRVRGPPAEALGERGAGSRWRVDRAAPPRLSSGPGQGQFDALASFQVAASDFAAAADLSK